MGQRRLTAALPRCVALVDGLPSLVLRHPDSKRALITAPPSQAGKGPSVFLTLGLVFCPLIHGESASRAFHMLHLEPALGRAGMGTRAVSLPLPPRGRPALG